MKNKNQLQRYLLVIVFFLINMAAYSQCICTLPAYGCSITNHGCIMACAYYCSHPACQSSASVTANDTLIFFTGDSVTLTGHRSGATAYQWMNDTANILGATSNNYVAYTSGKYKCKITNSCNTKTTAPLIVTVLQPTGIIYFTDKNGFTIYPNPASSVLNIDLRNLIKNIEIVITNVASGIIYRTVESETQRIVVDTKDFAAGAYIVKIQSKEFVQVQKFMVVK